MAWSAPWPAAPGDNYQDVLWIDDLDQAAHERLHVFNTVATTIPGNFHTAGDDLQTVFDGITYLGARAAQNYIATYCFGWIDPSLVYDGFAPDDVADWYWTLPKLLTAVGGDPSGFHAEYPKRYFATDPTTYDDGNTPVDGDYAINATEGRVYHRVAGAWVLEGNLGQAQPDTVTAFRTVLGNPVNKIQAGDYLNTTTLNEIHDLMDLLKWGAARSDMGFNNALGSEWNNFVRVRVDYEYIDSSDSGDQPDWATAQADVDANYIAEAPGASGTGTIDAPGEAGFFSGIGRNQLAVFSSGRFNAGPDTFGGDLDCSETKLRVKPDAANVFAFSTQFLVRVTEPLSTPIGFAIASGVFDANGADVVQNTWHEWDATGPANTDQTSVFLGRDRTTYTPNWCPAPSVSDPFTGQGWEVGNAQPGAQHGNNTGLVVILKFDVAGGFDKVT